MCFLYLFILFILHCNFKFKCLFCPWIWYPSEAKQKKNEKETKTQHCEMFRNILLYIKWNVYAILNITAKWRFAGWKKCIHFSCNQRYSWLHELGFGYPISFGVFYTYYYYYHSNLSGDGNIFGSKNNHNKQRDYVCNGKRFIFSSFLLLRMSAANATKMPARRHLDIIRILFLFCCTRIKMLELSDLTTPVRCTPTPIRSNHTHYCVRCMEL